MDLACVTVDCADPELLATFWSSALGWGTPQVATGGAGASCAPPSGGPYLEFVRVPEPKSVKNRLHLGCHVASVDHYDAEFERLIALGAALAWREVFSPEVAASYRNWVLLDPEGNEFCLGGGTWPANVPMPTDVPIEPA